MPQNRMVLTRLGGPLSRASTSSRQHLVFSKHLTRHASSAASKNGSEAQDNEPSSSAEPPKRRGKTSSKKFIDLPQVFVDAAGTAAKPLPEWNPHYLVPPPAPEPGEYRSIFCYQN